MRPYATSGVLKSGQHLLVISWQTVLKFTLSEIIRMNVCAPVEKASIYFRNMLRCSIHVDTGVYA